MSLRRGRAGRAALLVLAGLVLFPAIALAHQRLLGTSPERGSTVREVPRQLRLSFYEAVELTFTTVRLVGPDGAVVMLGRQELASDSANVLVVRIEGALRAGSYTAHWATASRDGHPVQGEFSFEIAEGAAGLDEDHAVHDRGELGAGATAPGQQPPAPEHHGPAAGPGSFQADAPGYVAVRWANYLGILGVIGSVVFRLLVLGHLRRRTTLSQDVLLVNAARRAAGVGAAAAVLTLAAGVGRLYAQSLAMHSAEFALDGERMLMLLQRTVWGWGWLLQMMAAGVAAAAFAAARRAKASDTATGAWSLAGLAGLALALTLALSGHAAAMTGTIGTIAIATHTLHVLAAGGWLGTLFVLMAAGVPAAMDAGEGRRGEAVAHLVRAFSRTALFFAGVLVASGVFAAFVHSSSLDALIGSRYGTLLFVKLGVFLLVLGTGAYNFLKVQPALGSEASVRHLKISAGAELVVAAVVLLVTAMLVATARPYEEDDQFAAREDPTAASVPAAASTR